MATKYRERKRERPGWPFWRVWCIPRLLVLLATVFGAGTALTQSSAPPVSYVRSYVNDVPDQPLVTVTVTGAVGVACFTIEEDLPGSASAVSVSGDGVWLPSTGTIRWGPYFNTVATNVSYRVTGMPATYPVNGGASMDGQWYFASGVTLVTVLPTGGPVVVPTPLPRVAAPVFIPPGGTTVPTNVTISSATTGAVVFYTLDGTPPTPASTLYTGAVYLATVSTIRAAAFTNGWTPSVAAVAWYGPPAAPASAQVTRSVDSSSPAAPVVSISVAPGANAACVAVTEVLPAGLGAVNVTAGGVYIASNNQVVWGPFFGTNAQALSYQAVGQPGTYPVQAAWSVDGIGGGEAVPANLVIASSSSSNNVPTPPLQVAAPVFTPASGANVPVNVMITGATPGATVYYTLDGSAPTPRSTLYTGPIAVANMTTIRAAAFMNGWTPSVASVAFYEPPLAPVATVQFTRSVDSSSPTAPLVTMTVAPGPNAACVTVTEWLPADVVPIGVSAGGNYVAAENAVLWGPFFGTNALTLSYQAVGLAGVYPVQASWSIDGVGGGESTPASLTLSGGATTNVVPTPPLQVPAPVLTPGIASSLPVSVSIACSDPQARIYFTTDGTPPNQNSAPYTTPLTFPTQTTLRARAFHAGYLPSVAAVGDYVPALPTNSILLARSVTNDGTFFPSVSLLATPQGAVSCYSVTETIALFLTPYEISGDGVWNPFDRTIRWGPYLDSQPRALSYLVGGPSGSYPLGGQGSFDGYAATVTGAVSLPVNTNSTGAAPTSIPVCLVDYMTYNVQIDPAPGVINVTSAWGSVDWGDGTQSAITNPVMTFQKAYSAANAYSVVISADWTGSALGQPVSGHATRTDTVQVISTCLAPSIIAGPVDQVVPVGGTAQFVVSASSPFPMSYQWYFNGTTPIVAASALSTLALPDVTPASAGLYSVVISNDFGSVTSTLARLSVISPAATRNPNGSVTLSFLGSPNSSVRLWAATNLMPPVVWTPVYTNSDIGPTGTWQCLDTNTVGTQRRFYRFSTP